MKLKNFLLGASLALCGAAFGQDYTHIYVPDNNTTYKVSYCKITYDEALNETNVEFTPVSSYEGGLDDIPIDCRPVLNSSGGVVVTVNNYYIICKEKPGSQCIWPY